MTHNAEKVRLVRTVHVLAREGDFAMTQLFDLRRNLELIGVEWDREVALATWLERLNDGDECISMRPTFDDYYLGIAKAVSKRGDCSRAQHGAVLVQGFRIVATGYNGTPPGDSRSCLKGDCPRAKLSYSELPSGSSYDTGPGACIATHAEANCLLRASWDDMQGATLYITGAPCGGCEKLINSTGIARVVHP